MRLALAALLSLGAIGCGNSSETSDMAAMDLAVHVADLSVKPADMVSLGDGGAEPLLVVNNTIAWCTVTVTINGVPTTFSATSSMSFMVPAGTTVDLKADPNPTFMPVKWTGVTTMSGDMATYLMTSSPTQSITACCAEPNGSGC